VRAFDRLSERERRLKIQLLQQEAEAYEARSSYVKDYGSMCAFGKSVSVKASGGGGSKVDRASARPHHSPRHPIHSSINPPLSHTPSFSCALSQALELMGRVKDGVDKLKCALQAQRGELVRRMEEATAEAAVRCVPLLCVAIARPGGV
jgi:hypothetical protein